MRRRRRYGWIVILFAAVMAVVGCHDKYPNGWIKLDVAAAPVPDGWKAIKDAESGLSFDVPPVYMKWTPGDDKELNAMTDAARHAPPGSSQAELPALPAGYHANLFLVDTSEDSLKQAAFSYICIVHMNAGKDVTIDEAEEDLKKLSKNPLERVDLPIGPALKQTVEGSTQFSNGSTTRVGSVAYYLLHGSDLYVVRFTGSDAHFAVVLSNMDAIMNTVRVGAGDPSAAVQASPPPKMSGPDSPAVGDPGSGSFQPQSPPPSGPTGDQTPGPARPQGSQSDSSAPPPETGTPQGPDSQSPDSSGSGSPATNSGGPDHPDQGQTSGSTGQ